MKKCYSKLHTACILIMLILCTETTLGQCLNGYEPTGKTFDTTVSTGSGNYESFFTFPKFHPDSGMVSCVKLIMTTTGIIESLQFENNSTSSNDYSAEYSRRDTLSGPGLTSPLTTSVNKTYGTFTLSAKVPPMNGGPDYILIENDTVLNKYTVSVTITDVNDIANFYGIDSITYRYGIKASTTPTGPGDYNFGVATIGFVNYRLEYCYCPPTVLPVGLLDFQVSKKNDDAATLNWKAETDTRDFYYEILVSKDGRNFKPAGIVQKKTGINPSYAFTYDRKNHETGQVYFRVQQHYHSGNTKYTDTRSIKFDNTLLNKISLYPNPSSGNVGIKFVNVTAGKLSIRISNVQGQTVVSKDIAVAGTDYKQIATLQRGMYWMKFTDVTTGETVVNQLLIK